MKVFELLFLGILCQLSASSSTPSNATSEDSVFLRIATSLDAHSRLAAALNTLAELINPTKPNSALGKYFLLDDSIISELTNLDGEHAARIVEELTDPEMNLTAFNEKSERFNMFQKLHQLINTTVIPGKSEKVEVAAIIGGWEKFDVLDLSLLTLHESNLKSMEHSDDVGMAQSRVRAAADALAAIPTLLKAITAGIPKLDGRHRVFEIFGGFEFLVSNLKTYTESSQLVDDDAANLGKLFSKSQSYQTGRRVARMLTELAQSSDFPKHMGIQLKHMLDGETLRKVLNKGEDLWLLKTILNPFFEVEPVLLSIWKDLRLDVNTMAFKESSDSVLRLLNLITMAGYSSEGEFKSSWAHLNRILKPDISISGDVAHFLEIFQNLTGAFDEYTEILKKMKNLTESDKYNTAINGVEFVKDLEKAVVIKIVTPDPQPIPLIPGATCPSCSISTVERPPFKEAVGKVNRVLEAFSPILVDLKSINSKIRNIKEKINIFSNWKSNEVEEWLQKTSKDLRRSTDQNLIFRMSHVFKFIDSPPQSTSNFSDFTHVCSKLAASVKTGMSQVEGLRTKLSNLKHDRYTKYVMQLNQYNLAEKFQSGLNLFKLFDQFIRASADFDTFFKQGDLVETEIRSLDYKDENRRGWVDKMKIFQSIKSQFFKMKAEILKKRKFYTPESIENLMSLRWLVENLADIPNPGLRVSEWSEFAKEVKKSRNTTSVTHFESSVSKIFDLNFAAHQEKCSMAYSNYKALLRFLKSILAAEKVSHLTFWDYNKNWIKIVGFCFLAILINVVIYVLTHISLERKAKESQESEELEDFNEKWEEFEKRKRGQFMGTY